MWINKPWQLLKRRERERKREREIITLMDNNTLTYIHMVALNNEILIVDTLVRVKKELKGQK